MEFLLGVLHPDSSLRVWCASALDGDWEPTISQVYGNRTDGQFLDLSSNPIFSLMGAILDALWTCVLRLARQNSDQILLSAMHIGQQCMCCVTDGMFSELALQVLGSDLTKQDAHLRSEFPAMAPRRIVKGVKKHGRSRHDNLTRKANVAVSCANCAAIGAGTSSLKQYSRCCVRYCGEGCQLHHWRVHKRQCKAFKTLQEKSSVVSR
jgi:hypothetical protein